MNGGSFHLWVKFFVFLTNHLKIPRSNRKVYGHLRNHQKVVALFKTLTGWSISIPPHHQNLDIYQFSTGQYHSKHQLDNQGFDNWRITIRCKIWTSIWSDGLIIITSSYETTVDSCSGVPPGRKTSLRRENLLRYPTSAESTYFAGGDVLRLAVQRDLIQPQASASKPMTLLNLTRIHPIEDHHVKFRINMTTETISSNSQQQNNQKVKEEHIITITQK